jgi:hypothetical protein
VARTSPTPSWKSTAAHQRFSAGRWRLPADNILVVDHAADVEPGVIAEFAQHAARTERGSCCWTRSNSTGRRRPLNLV